ncbi:MAG: hydrogenase maturation nickel metallochaperone HypA [Oligoflexia bacterium]|nr:hydrogenase maturation nickel metallochaperone HypA [Oligoflexia bacterium]
MHEASLAHYALDILSETVKNDPSLNDSEIKIKKITFSVGPFSNVYAESFEFYFSELVKGTTFASAKLEFVNSEENGFFVSSIEI